MATTKKPSAKTTRTKKNSSTASKNPAKDNAKKTSRKTKSPVTANSGSKASVSVDRRKSTDRRSANDRRQKSEPVAVERRSVERRKKVNRRRQIDPTTCERDYTPEEVEFMNALDDYKRTSGRMFPTCSEVLEVLRDLGYAKRSADSTESAANSSSVPEPEAETRDEAALAVANSGNDSR